MNKANEIRALLGMSVGWSAQGRTGVYTRKGPGVHATMAHPYAQDDGTTRRRRDKMNGERAGIPKHLQQHAKRHTHILSDMVTDKNLAILANRKLTAAR